MEIKGTNVMGIVKNNFLGNGMMNELAMLKSEYKSAAVSYNNYGAGCGCSGTCGQSCSGGCETGCKGGCGRSCSGSAS